MRDIIHKMLDDPFETAIGLFMLISVVCFAVSLVTPTESSEEKSLRLYKECMETQNADKQTCKEIAGIESNRSNN